MKRDAIPNIVLNTLYKYTSLQSSFSVNNIALVKGRPELLNLKDMIHHFVEHRHEVVIRRTVYELRKAEERAHILEGLIIASDNIDEVIALIRSSSNADQAREKLINRFQLSEIQAKAIVEMRLRQLTGLEPITNTCYSLPKKENVSGCGCMKFLKAAKRQKVEPSKIL